VKVAVVVRSVRLVAEANDHPRGHSVAEANDHPRGHSAVVATDRHDHLVGAVNDHRDRLAEVANARHHRSAVNVLRDRSAADRLGRIARDPVAIRFANRLADHRTAATDHSVVNLKAVRMTHCDPIAVRLRIGELTNRTLEGPHVIHFAPTGLVIDQ
jgi:hypothetical protein